jgi:23S rRNA (adenine2503-C2)-methyltransferase
MFGCPVGCKFCSSGLSYFGKIDGEDIAWMVKEIITRSDISTFPDGNKVLVSFMGSGEPMLNSEEVIAAIQILNRIGFRFSLATSGVGIGHIWDFINNKYIGLVKPKLTISLHSSFDTDRMDLIPNTASIGTIIRLASDYAMAVGPVQLNYVLLEGINDSILHAEALAALVRQFGFHLKINRYNDVGRGFVESSRKVDFINELSRNLVNPELYFTDGVDIAAGCGQLRSSLQEPL